MYGKILKGINEFTLTNEGQKMNEEDEHPWK